ncbi:MAG: hypothetical protein JOY99_13110 [Sphingomonadaceae bacterium]|nr:hypothetical protein [Sphingomonadaceae bacterium]
MADMDDDKTSKGESAAKPPARRRTPAKEGGTARARRAPAKPATPAAARPAATKAAADKPQTAKPAAKPAPSKPASSSRTSKSETKPVSASETKSAAKSHSDGRDGAAAKSPTAKSESSVNWLGVGIGSAAAIGSAAVAAAMLYSKRSKPAEPPKSSKAPSLKDDQAGGD